jgi:CBS domain-containing protein
MSLKTMVRTDVATFEMDAPVSEAARTMEERNIGCVIIVEQRRPVGVLTDRDLVVRVLNRGKDPRSTRVSEAMTPSPVMLQQDLGLSEALEQARGKPIRRFPVVDSNGHLTGIFTVDDVVRLVGKEMGAVATILEKEAAYT